MSGTKKLTCPELFQRKAAKKIIAVTAYDYSFAKLLDEQADLLLVGDSLGMVMQGEQTTLGVTMEQMIYHARCVSRGCRHALLVVDMPFMSYQVSREEAVRNAGRLVAEGHAEAVKLEGGTAIAETVEHIVSCVIPVSGHVGLTPQSVHAFGGYKIQGKTDSSRSLVLHDAIALEESGATAIVLEGMPTELAKEITARLKIPTIGIGAGNYCDGQVLVLQDLLGMNVDFRPKFVKQYADFSGQVQKALTQYVEEVRSGTFPGPEHSF